jgi:hypothetical protein
MAKKRKIPKGTPSNAKIRHTTHGTPVIMKYELGVGIYLVEDFAQRKTCVAKEDLQ